MSREEKATLLLTIKEKGLGVIESIVGKLNVVDLAISAIVATSAFLWKATEAFAEQEKAVNELTGAMIGQGVYTTELKNKYIEMADSLQDLTNADDTQILSSQAILQSHLGQIEVTEELMKATIALSLKKKIDLATASEMVGKTIAGETNMLKKQGIEFDNTATGGDRLVQVLTAIESKTAGAISSNMQGIAGASKTLANAWDDFLKGFGSRTGPILEDVTRSLAKFLNFITPGKAGSDIQAVDAEIRKLEASMAATQKRLEKVSQGGTLATLLYGSQENIKKDLIAQNVLLAEANGQREALMAKDNAMAAESRASKQAQIDAERVLNREKLAEEEYKDAEVLLAARQQSAILFGEQNEAEKLAEAEADVRAWDRKINNAKSFQEKNALLDKKTKDAEALRELQLAQAKEKIQKDTFATIATLADSHNSAMRGIGKAAVMAQKAMAISQIAIDTPVAISKTMAAFPYPVNIPLAAAVGIAMAAQAAAVAGVQLADGGIVMPRPGGIQATIGEGGQAEAVIPLDRAAEFGMGGGGTTVNFYGPVLGDESQARRFAEVLDRELYNMRKSNTSLSFEGII